MYWKGMLVSCWFRLLLLRLGGFAIFQKPMRLSRQSLDALQVMNRFEHIATWTHKRYRTACAWNVLAAAAGSCIGRVFDVAVVLWPAELQGIGAMPTRAFTESYVAARCVATCRNAVASSIQGPLVQDTYGQKEFGKAEVWSLARSGPMTSRA